MSISRLNKFIKGQSGSALIAALAAMLILDTFAVAVMALTTTQLTATGRDKRSSEALNVAEAGMNSAFWKITYDPDFTAPPSTPATGSVQGGQYEIVMENVAGEPTQRVVTVTGYSPQKDSTYPPTVKRKIEATIEVAPRVLSYGMYAFSWIDIRGATARTYMAPLDYRAANAKGGDFGSNYNIFFNDAGIMLNDRGNQEGERRTYDALFGNPAVPMGDIVTAGPNSQVWAVNEFVSTYEALHNKIPRIWMNSILHLSNQIAFPTLNFEGPPYEDSYKKLAADNTANGSKNSSSGNGVYTAADFQTKVLDTGNNVTITGMIYVDGDVSLPNNKNLTITDGGLVIKDNVGSSDPALKLANRASLVITHTTDLSKKYPGLATYSSTTVDAKVVDRGTMQIDGLVYSENTYSEQQSSVRIKGALMASGVQTAASIVNDNSSIIIQYDPAVTSMFGISQPGDVFVSRVINWKELRP